MLAKVRDLGMESSLTQIVLFGFICRNQPFVPINQW